MEKLNLFFTRIKELSFWQRIFSWKSVKVLSYDAFEEFKNIERKMIEQNRQLEETRNTLTKVQVEKEGLERQSNDLENQHIKKDSQIDNLNSRVTELHNKISNLEAGNEQRMKEHGKSIAEVNQMKRDLEIDRARFNDQKIKEERDRFEQMKKQWSDHQSDVEQAIRSICQTHIIKYLDDVPFNGKPDNTIEICDEYIIFDAKSPANDNLTNFPKYIKHQVENLSKYANQESVRKDIFLVVPSNTIDILDRHSYSLADYNVFIITKDSLEPVILSLKKIEEYEFAEQLSPEDRDNICRVLGKFAHTTKRKIQVDQFFNREFIDLLIKSSQDLPDEFVKSIAEYEKGEKLNPPSERRTKRILTSDLKEKNDLIDAEAEIRNIEIPVDTKELKELV